MVETMRKSVIIYISLIFFILSVCSCNNNHNLLVSRGVVGLDRYANITDGQSLNSTVVTISNNVPNISSIASTPVIANTTESSNPLNPFGLMLGNTIKSPGDEIEVAKNMGARYYRFGVTLTEVPDNITATKILNNGLNAVITIRYNGNQKGPSSPPPDISVFKNSISKVIDRDHPSVLVYENEEDSPNFNFYTGNNTQYLEGLKAVCEVAHQKGVKCANGGITSASSVLVTADYYENENPNSEKFNIVTNNTLHPYFEKIFQDGGNTTTNPYFADRIISAKELISKYKENGADYMNFHWHAQSSAALALVIEVLRNQSGLPVITNEFAPETMNTPDGLFQLLNTFYELQVPIAIEYALGSNVLTNSDGTLLSDGQVYQQFMNQHFSASK